MKQLMQPKIRSLKYVWLTLFLLFFCTACSWFGGDTGKPAQVKHSSSISNAAPAPIGLGVQVCPDAVKSPDAWKNTVALGVGQGVERVLCGNLLGIPALQAVVLVRHTGSDKLLDIFVYSDITVAHPKAIFDLMGLLHGDAKISGYNTLLTAQEDRNSLYNKGQTNQWTADLCREYKWSDAAGALIQVPFSGIFPDLTRYQAEFEQREVNNGQGFQQWRLSAVTTTQRFCEALLKWPLDIPVKVLSGGGDHDIHATVQVKQPSSSPITIKLDRLERNTSGGLWEVIDVQTDNLAVTVPHSDQPLTSPVLVSGHGSGNSTIGTIGTIHTLDHVYNDSGQSEAWDANSTGTINFSKPLSYTLSFQGGAQEGVIALSIKSGSDGRVMGMVMVKVLLSA